MLFRWILIASAFVALMIPIVFIRIRESTKRRRQGIVEDLSSVFDQPHDHQPAVIPSFEFVKYKYFVPSQHRGFVSRSGGDYLVAHWFLAAIPLVTIVFALNAFSGVVVVHAAFKQDIGLPIPWVRGAAEVPLFAWVALASYVGGLLFTLRSFNQAINNFDMSPLSLVGATVNLAFGVSSALLVIFTASNLAHEIRPDNRLIDGFPIYILTAFAAGYFPDVAVRQLIDASKLTKYKKYQGDLYDIFKAIPVDIIDGIDTEIRSRLADYHIGSVQSLAATNPLMLFVETPYGVYQIMDWVAQAQLCVSVGPATLVTLWRLGIRTIFDVERVAFDEDCYDECLLREVGAILWNGQDIGPDMSRGMSRVPVYPSVNAILADIRVRLESPHVHRLRQIFNRVSLSLGDDARSLPPIPLRKPVKTRGYEFARGAYWV